MEERKNIEEVNTSTNVTEELDVGDKIYNLNEDYATTVAELKLAHKQKVAEYKKKKSELSPEESSRIAQELANEKAEIKETIRRKKEELKAELVPLKEQSKVEIASATDKYKGRSKTINENCKEKMLAYKEEYKMALAKENEEYAAKLAELKSKLDGSSKDERESVMFDINNEKYTHKQRLHEIKNKFLEQKQSIKDEKHDAFMHYYRRIQKHNGGKPTAKVKMERKLFDYVYQFNINDYLLRNGLYIIIVLFIIVSCIVAPLIGRGNLLTLSNILQIMEQSSTRTFFALGVAGLILLGGTDLSIGRHVGMATVMTCMFLHPGLNIIKLFGADVDFSSIPMGVNVILALLVSVALCSAFSVLAGFFTAKLNMHPFVTTLSTQLIIFGLTCYATGTTSSGSIDSNIKRMLAGRIGDFPILIIYAIVCIIVMWFIWNKTRFGKNMYAVGGNKEAAAVSGINVFKTTLLVFLMAGVLYGVGSFLEGLRIGTAVATTGTGYELDAIAACVVGGISFSGGIGKIKGAVIGVLLFTAITYILTFLGLDANIQFILKGVIIMAAVALDSVKYLKKK